MYDVAYHFYVIGDSECMMLHECDSDAECMMLYECDNGTECIMYGVVSM